MSNFQTAELIYFLVLGGALMAMFVLHNRQGLGATLRQLLTWALIFVAVLAGYGLWEDVRRTVVPSQTVIADENRVVVPRGPDGHFHLILDINGTPVKFLVDTGASDLVLSRSDAEHAGIDLSKLGFHGRARTANGEVRTAPIWLDEVRLGPFADRNVRASVNGGEMSGSLLGMSYLNRFGRIEIAGNELVLSR